MFEVGVESTFQATHRLVGDFGPASQPHAHDYRVRVAVTGGSLRADGTLCDIAWLQVLVDEAVRSLDSNYLNENEPFVSRNPTAENVALHLFEALARDVRGAGGLATLSVEVWESDAAYARYTAPLA